MHIFDLPAPLKFLQLRDETLHRYLQGLLRDFRIDLVHVHLTMNNSLEMIYAAKELGLPVFATLHDHYVISPDHGLSYKYRHGQWHWDLAESPLHYYLLFGLRQFDVDRWRREMAKALQKVDEVFFPSESALSDFKRYFQRKDSCRIIEHASAWRFVAESLRRVLAPPQLPSIGGAFSVCFLGYVHAPNKGSDLLRKLIPALLAKGYAVHLLGTPKKHWRHFLKQKNFHVHGMYSHETVVKSLRTIRPDAVALVSCAPETFGFTLTEAWAAGLPVVATPAGAVAERIRKTGAGLVAEDFSVRAFLAVLEPIKDRGAAYRTICSLAQTVPLKTPEQMGRIYHACYHSIPAVCRKPDLCIDNVSENSFQNRGLGNYWKLKRGRVTYRDRMQDQGKKLKAVLGRLWGMLLSRASRSLFTDRVESVMVYDANRLTPSLNSLHKPVSSFTLDLPESLSAEEKEMSV